MKDKIKSFLFWYQRNFWFIGITNGELRKPLAYLNETLLLLTFLSVRGINLSVATALLIYFGILFLADILGRILVALGIVAYNTRIANTQNPELLAILEKVGELERKIDDLRK